MKHSIQLGNQTVSYTIRESKRARHIRLKIDPKNGLQVVIPHGIKVPKNLETVLQERHSWILKHLDTVKIAEPARPRQFVTGELIPFLGQAHTLEIMETHTLKRTKASKQGMSLRVRLRANISESRQREEIRTALEHWYREQAKQVISERVAELAQAYGFRHGKITIRGQKTRWGSCSSKGNLNFNWRLVMAPPEVIDYLIIHELCHLREMNHSPRFWALVATYCPDYKRWKHWLKENNSSLHL